MEITQQIAGQLVALHRDTPVHDEEYRAERARVLEAGLNAVALLILDAEERILLGKEG